MPVMSAHTQSDARGAVWLLATAATKCIDDPASVADNRVALNNVYRLLEAFRTNAFFGIERASRRGTTPGAAILTMGLPSQTHVKDVRYAIEQAIDAAFSDGAKEEAIRTVEDTLRGIAFPKKYPAPESEALRKTAAFFDFLKQRLQLGNDPV